MEIKGQTLAPLRNPRDFTTLIPKSWATQGFTRLILCLPRTFVWVELEILSMSALTSGDAQISFGKGQADHVCCKPTVPAQQIQLWSPSVLRLKHRPSPFHSTPETREKLVSALRYDNNQVLHLVKSDLKPE